MIELDDGELRISEEHLMQNLQKLQDRGSDLSPVMRKCSAIMLSSVQTNFREQGRPKWAPLKPSTIAQRTKEGKWPGMILQKSQAGLLPSIQASSDDKSAMVSTNKTYAKMQNFGGTIPARTVTAKNKKALAWAGARHPVKSVHIPATTIVAREFMKIQEEDLQDMLDVTKKHLME